MLCLFFTDNLGAGSKIIAFWYPVDRFFVSKQICNVYCILFWWEPIHILPMPVHFIVKDNPWSFIFPVISKYIVFYHVHFINHCFTILFFVYTFFIQFRVFPLRLLALFLFQGTLGLPRNRCLLVFRFEECLLHFRTLLMGDAFL